MRSIQGKAAQIYATLALVFVFVIDIYTSPGFAVGILYILCSLLVYSEEKNTIIGFSVLAVMLIILRLFISFPTEGPPTDEFWLILVNRGISVLAVILIAWVALRQKRHFRQTFEDSKGISDILGFNEEFDREGRIQKNASEHTNNLLFASAGMMLIFILDLLVPLGIAVGAFYIVCFLFIYNEQRRVILAFAIFTPVLILAKAAAFFVLEIPVQTAEWSIWANRVISVTVVIFTAVLALRHRAMLEKFNEERERYIRMLEASNEKLGAINKAVNQSLLSAITDTKGNFIYVNKLFRKTYQYSSKELVGKNHCLLNSGHHSDAFFQEMWDTILDGKTWFGEQRNKAKDGSLHWVDMVIVPVKDKTGAVIQFYAMSKVIDDRKKLEEQLLKSNEEMQQFTYVAAHDLRSPVINMSVLSEMLEEVNGVTEEGKEYFDKIKQSIQQLELTISKLNEVIAAKRNLGEIPEEIEFSSELDYVLHSIENLIRSSGAQIQSDFVAAPRICLAKVQMHSIFQNLISNSIKYRREDVNPVIKIKSWIQDNRVCLSVSDNGIGIDLNSHSNKLFGLFKRFHQHVEGKGIGLYLVKSIIDNHGGTIQVESKINEGTTFNMCFDLPQNQNQPSKSNNPNVT
jgi:PAS domain S-box-containing protein